MIGPTSYSRPDLEQLGYHVTIDSTGAIVALVPSYGWPEGTRGMPWDWSSLDYINKVGGLQHIIRHFDFDALSIHVAGNSEPKEQNTMNLTPRQRIIVSLLKAYPTGVRTGVMQVHTGAPAATIRRNIASLRNKGFNIDSTPVGYALVSELVELASGVATVANQGPQSEVDDLRDEYAAPEYHGDDYDPFEAFEDILDDAYLDDELESDDPFDGLDD